MGNSASNTVHAVIWVDAVKDTLRDGEGVSHAREDIVNHLTDKHEVIGERLGDLASHEVVGKAAEKVAEFADKVTGETTVSDALGAGAEWALEGADNALKLAAVASRGVAEHGAEAVHTVSRTVNKATDVPSLGLPDAEPSAIDPTSFGPAGVDLTDGASVGEFIDGLEVGEAVSAAVKTAVSAVARDDATGFASGVLPVVDQCTSAVEEAVSAVVETAVPAIAGEAATACADAVLDAFPVVGQCTSAWKIIRGSLTAIVGVGCLIAAAAVKAVGYFFKQDESAKSFAAKTATWGASVLLEGVLVLAQGATNMSNIVPGTQFATIPVSILLGVASARCASARSE